MMPHIKQEVQENEHHSIKKSCSLPDLIHSNEDIPVKSLGDPVITIRHLTKRTTLTARVAL
jgi:hypothetical protein